MNGSNTGPLAASSAPIDNAPPASFAPSFRNPLRTPLAESIEPLSFPLSLNSFLAPPKD